MAGTGLDASVQLMEPSLFANVPGGQGSHADMPVPGWKKFRAQGWHLVEPPLGEKKPALQPVHCDAPGPEM